MSSRNTLLVLMIIWSGCGSPTEGENPNKDADMRPAKVICEPHYHPETPTSRVCVEDALQFAEERTFKGVMTLAMEHQTFREDIATSGSLKPELWISFLHTELERCFANMAAARMQPLEVEITFRGRLALDNGRSGFGHEGAFPGQVQVTRLLSQNPCRSQS